MANHKTGNRKKTPDPFRFWHARIWHGMRFSVWVSLLARNRFRISPSRYFLALTISITSVFNSVLGLVQAIVIPDQLLRTKTIKSPIFIIGHWRSGTTLLHELMVLDEQFAYANTYQCMTPGHFLITSWMVTRLPFLLPKKRPMDGMIAGWQRPQEDEFALANMGQRSPYLSIAFPNEDYDPGALTLQGLSEKQLGKWKRALIWFYRRLSVIKDKQIVVKSPTHTARIDTLIEMFPDAKFIYLVRDPVSVFCSTVKLWQALDISQSLQKINHNELEERVLSTYESMAMAYEKNRHLIPEGQLLELRFEDFIKEPTKTLEALYEKFDLGDFAAMRPQVDAYFAARADYEVEEYSVEPEVAQEIERRWGPLAKKFRRAADKGLVRGT